MSVAETVLVGNKLRQERHGNGRYGLASWSHVETETCRS